MIDTRKKYRRIEHLFDQFYYTFEMACRQALADMNDDELRLTIETADTSNPRECGFRWMGSRGLVREEAVRELGRRSIEKGLAEKQEADHGIKKA